MGLEMEPVALQEGMHVLVQGNKVGVHRDCRGGGCQEVCKYLTSGSEINRVYGGLGYHKYKYLFL